MMIRRNLLKSLACAAAARTPRHDHGDGTAGVALRQGSATQSQGGCSAGQRLDQVSANHHACLLVVFKKVWLRVGPPQCRFKGVTHAFVGNARDMHASGLPDA